MKSSSHTSRPSSRVAEQQQQQPQQQPQQPEGVRYFPGGGATEASSNVFVGAADEAYEGYDFVEEEQQPQQPPQWPSAAVSRPSDAASSSSSSLSTAAIVLRDFQTKHQARWDNLGDTFPKVIYFTDAPDKEALVRHFQATFARNLFSVRKTGTMGANDVKVQCCKAEAPSAGGHGKGTGCKWYVIYRQVQGGQWALTSASPPAGGETLEYQDHMFPCRREGTKSMHNHPMYETAAHAAADVSGSRGERMPVQYHKMAALLAKAGQTASQIHNVLRQAASDDQIDVTWDREHIQYLFTPSSTKKEMDFSGLLDSLERNLSALGLRYFVSVKNDGTNELTGVFLELPGGLGEWAKGGDTNTVLFDPTHGTNAYRMKLCLFTGVGQHGKTIIYAAAVLAAESQDMFRWAFRCFHNVFMVKPLSVFTDRDYTFLERCQMQYMCLVPSHMPPDRASSTSTASML